MRKKTEIVRDGGESAYKPAELDSSRKIGVIFTGGTFLATDSKDEGRNVYDDTSEKNIEHTLSMLDGFTYEEFHQINIDSSDVVDTDWQKIANMVKEHQEYNQSEKFDGYVVIHGTDTMEYTSSMLSFIMKGIQKPMILTGSMIPIDSSNSDAPGNLIRSMIAASTKNLQGVHVVFDKKLLLGSRVRKIDTNRVDTFDTLDFSPLGIFTEKDIADNPDLLPYDLRIHENLVGKLNEMYAKSTSEIYENMCTEIGIIKLTPSTNLDIFDFHLKKKTKVLIIEGFGDGNTPSITIDVEKEQVDKYGPDISKWDKGAYRGKKIFQQVQKCIDNGMYVILGSQCNTGVVDHKYTGGKGMLERGVMSAQNMTTPAIYAKMAHLLKNSSNIVNDFKKDIVGELLDNSKI